MQDYDEDKDILDEHDIASKILLYKGLTVNVTDAISRDIFHAIIVTPIGMKEARSSISKYLLKMIRKCNCFSF